MNINELTKKFDNLEKTDIDRSSPDDCRKFLESFIHEINDKYGLKLTVIDACKMIKGNIHNLDIKPPMKNVLIATISMLESDSAENKYIIPALRIKGLYWPTKWNWFGLNKKKHKRNCQLKMAIAQLYPNRMEEELPSNCYIGAVELFAGALVFILPVPGAQALGTLMMGDGVRRVVDGVMQLGDERRANPNFVPPKLGPPFENL